MTETTTQQIRTATLSTNAVRDIVMPIASLVDECVFRLSDDEGLTVAAVDPANVAMVEAQLKPSAFESLDAREEIAFGVNVRNLARLLDRDRDLGETLTLTVDEGPRKFTLEVGQYEFTDGYTLSEYIRDEPDIPELDLTADVELPGKILRDAVGFVAPTDDHINIVYDAVKQSLSITAEGSTADAVWTARRDDLNIRERGHADSRFSTDYTTDIVSEIPDDQHVRIQVGEEYPMKLSFGIVDGDAELGEHYLGEVTFMQAPRIAV